MFSDDENNMKNMLDDSNQIGVRQDKLRWLVFWLVAVFFAWFGWGFFLWYWPKERFPDLASHSNYGDMFGGINALFSAFAFAGLIYTILLQRKELSLQRRELELTRKELHTISQDNKANAVFDMYQMYTTEPFIEVRARSWFIFFKCVKSKRYFDFFVKTQFITEYRSDRFTEELVNDLRDLYAQDIYPDKSDLVRAENRDRHHILNLMNFFNTLALRDAPKDAFQRCDFFYDWWRPFMWLVADATKAHFQSLPQEERRYVIEPTWSGMVERLDKIYGFVTGKTAEERWKEFCDHPLIRHLSIDPQHSCPKLTSESTSNNV